MADSLDYLSPDFELNSLTVPRLRSILVNHDVPYPASAKKAQLIRILEEEVLPQARKLLRERERVKRTSEGITDMGSRGTSVASDAEHQRESMPPPPTPSSVASTTGGRRGRPKRTTRASTADTEEGTAPPATPSTASRRTATRSEARYPRESPIAEEGLATPTPAVVDAVTPRKSTGRRLRHSDAIPSTEPAEVPSVKVESKDEAIFTYDNPFQSGSPQAPVSYDGKRKSSPRYSVESPVKEGLRARKSEIPSSVKQRELRGSPRKSAYGISPPRFESPVVEEMEQEQEEEEDDYESEVGAGEEFTPDEQLALEREQADLHYQPRAPVRRQQRKQGKASKAAPWVVVLSLVGSFAGWWRKEKIEIGFCGIGKPTWSLAETKVPEWANVLEPRCEPCPPHAFCYPGFEARCEHDFVLKPHPLSLGGLVPVAPTCEPDSEKARRVKAVADKAVEELRDRRAKWECGELTEDGKEAKSPEINEVDLKREVGKKRRKGMEDAEFDDLWKGALGEIIGRDEIVTKTHQPSSDLILTSTSISRLPLTCAFRHYVRRSVLAYRLPLSFLAVCVSMLVYARSRVRARRSDMARVPELVATTLDRLATQAALHARGKAHESYISVGQLRDDVLRSELHGSRREELWRRVRTVVEGNANIRTAVREGRGGDVARVWEWIGGIGGVGGDHDSSARRRDSSNMSSHASLQEESRYQAFQDGSDRDYSARSPRESRTWDEGRPIY